MMTTKPILSPNLGIFCQMLVDHAKQGWDIDSSNPVDLYGYMYECQMVRDEDVIDPPPKPTQAEILAKARAAKAERKAAEAAAAKTAESLAEKPAETPASTSEETPAANLAEKLAEDVSEKGTQTSDKSAE